MYCIATGRNLAKGNRATQSSTYRTGNASLAVDGDTSAADTAHLTCAHTNEGNETIPSWWSVDLGNMYPITGVKIYNRQAGGKFSTYFNYILHCIHHIIATKAIAFV